MIINSQSKVDSFLGSNIDDSINNIQQQDNSIVKNDLFVIDDRDQQELLSIDEQKSISRLSTDSIDESSTTTTTDSMMITTGTTFVSSKEQFDNLNTENIQISQNLNQNDQNNIVKTFDTTTINTFDSNNPIKSRNALRLKLSKSNKSSNQYKIPKIEPNEPTISTISSEQSSIELSKQPIIAMKNLNSSTPTTTTTKIESNQKSSTIVSNKKEEKSSLKQLLLSLWKQLQRKDPNNFFAQPVSDSIAPGYSTIITQPMDLSTIKTKIIDEYRTLGDFKSDVKLMCDNAMKYNRPETIYYKTANKLWHYTKNKLFKKDSVLDYTKKYPRLTPLELSLMPSNQVMMSKFTTSFNRSMFQSNTTSSSSSSSFIGLHDSNHLAVTGQSKCSSTTSSNRLRNKNLNEKLFDGLTATELIESVQQTARQARERLQSSRRGPTYLSYLKQCDDQNLVLCSIDDQKSEPRILRPFNLDFIYQPNESGRIDVNVLTSSTTTTSTTSTINTNSLNLSHTKLLNQQVINNNNNTMTTIATTTNESSSSSDIIDNNNDLIKDENDQSNTVVDHSTNNNNSDNQNSNNNDDEKDEKNENSLENNSIVDKSNDNKIEEKERLLKELIEELKPCYGCEEFGLDYALSIAKFARNSEYTFSLVTSLLSVLTDNKHRQIANKFHKLMQEQFDVFQSTTSI
ncbi:Bromodomain containing protein 7 [Dermatophagoides pteronyssinus]|uniref:Bromodomain containing protein 7 n=1 Tax=Dermatophagoides pteronyssinus TaxID=6956 RepID=A0ABQ8J6Q4_DERPT|nr:Bromodomain containing protein 7 [Dermatophagoides pteronyssinus]